MMALLDATPGSLDEYLAREGGRGLERARSMAPDDLIAVIEAAGLRGRGGAGFPTATKWRGLWNMAPAASLDLPVDLVLGPDEYLLGEETGLLEAVERALPLPRVTRPFMKGLFSTPDSDNPTLVNNAETLANVPAIVADGPEPFRRMGTTGSPGTMLFTLAGDVVAPGVYELPMGLPLRYLIEDIGGGCPEGRAVQAVLPGASNTVITPEMLDVPLDFEE